MDQTNRKQTAATILIVDDEARNVSLLQTLLESEGYATLAAGSGARALALAVAEAPDLILLDIMMPDMDGFETVARLKSDPRTQAVPVIMVTSLDDRKSKLRALDCGAEEFLTKPIDRADLSVRVRNLLRLKEYNDFLADHNRRLEAQVKKRTAQLEDAFADIDAAYRETLFTLARAAEYRDEESGRHVQRVSRYCGELATAMRLGAEFREAVVNASPMHDIGKIGIPDHILLKPGTHTPEESAIMKTHAALGARILALGRSPYLRMGSAIALCHHECWDGSGYPNGLVGDAIPLAARLMRVGDVYDALRSRRPYKPPLDHDRAVAVLLDGDGRTHPGQFDPAVLTAFAAAAGSFAAIYEEYGDD